MSLTVTVVQPPLRLGKDFIDYPYHSDLGVVQAAAVLRDAGLAVSVVDAFALRGPGVRRLNGDDVVLGVAPAQVLTQVGEPDVVIIRLAPHHRPPLRDLLLAECLESMREILPSVPIVLADLYQGGEHALGYDASAALEAYPEVDVLLRHEAEAVLVGLCRDLAASGRPEKAWCKDGGEIENFNALPVPAWDLIDLEARDAFMSAVQAELGPGRWAFPIDGRTLPAVTSRGCPFRCIHCSSNPGRAAGDAKIQRRLGAGPVDALISALVGDLGATRIHVLDEMVNLDREHFEGLLRALTAAGVDFDIPNGMRADRLAPEHLERMKGRITTLSVSAESGCQRVVDEVIGKNLDLVTVEAVVARAAELRMSTLVHYLIGLPGESREEINQTLEHALNLWSSYAARPSVQFATPLPGTRLEQEARRAAGGAQPTIRDYGPLFQHQPSTSSDDFGADDLRLFKWTFDQRIAAGRRPKKVIINVTYRCNNHCAFCAVGDRSRRDGSYEKQAEALVKYGRRGVRAVDFDGGEPTLYPGLVKLIGFARQIGYEQVNVTTNGRTCFYESFARRLTGSGLTSLLISLHGPDAATHAAQVGEEDAWRQTVGGIENCIRTAPAAVELGVNTTLTRSNVGSLPKLVQLCWDLGVRWLNMQFLTPFGRATAAIEPDSREAAHIVMSIIDSWRDRMKLQVVNLPFCVLPGYEEHVVGDLLKVQRTMVFVTEEEVNLYDYLSRHRRYGKECPACPHKVFCAGFYEHDGAAEPE